ncbi:MAG: hypothetical protein V1726_07940 [Methanobacteriota archaeon]
MMNLVNLLVFAYLAISGGILSYVLIITDKTRKTAKKKQTGDKAVMVVPVSIVFLLVLYALRFGLMTGTGVFSGVGLLVLVGVLVAVVPLIIVGFFIIKNKPRLRGGSL